MVILVRGPLLTTGEVIWVVMCMGNIYEGGNVEITCAKAEGRTRLCVVRNGTGRLVVIVGNAALVVLSEGIGAIESMVGVPVVVWPILQEVVVCVPSKGGTTGVQDA